LAHATWNVVCPLVLVTWKVMGKTWWSEKIGANMAGWLEGSVWLKIVGPTPKSEDAIPWCCWLTLTNYWVCPSCHLFEILEISGKSRKYCINTLSLVIHGVRFFKKLAKKYIIIQRGGVKLRKPWILMVPEFHPVFLFSWAPPLFRHRFSLLL